MPQDQVIESEEKFINNKNTGETITPSFNLPPTPEVEARPEMVEVVTPTTVSTVQQPAVQPQPVISTPVVAPLLPAEQLEIKEVEQVLSENLVELYKNMDPATQRQFKLQGEDTARNVNIILHQAKIKIQEIVDLIVAWLKIIPGINKFFVEQQAKIKIDKLLALKNKRDLK